MSTPLRRKGNFIRIGWKCCKCDEVIHHWEQIPLDYSAECYCCGHEKCEACTFEYKLEPPKTRTSKDKSGGGKKKGSGGGSATKT
ncbi:hypothetical protein BP6252_12581 [Coleophoma cylindrospora]|uniref:Uncharacterized protein n=1 Tax=Coleophoma cylindrospora TaxID=1849047 RepID=A0A3D8QDJ1_9HELO|nr:hypothetical protein BP6252_12581 [Coleophoma cylindrospora]